MTEHLHSALNMGLFASKAAKKDLSTETQIFLVSINWWRAFTGNNSSKSISTIIVKYAHRYNIYKYRKYHWAEFQRLFYKLCLIGDCNVGKTSLRSRYVNQRYTHQYKPTIDVKCNLHHDKWADGPMKHIEMYEAPGDQRFSHKIYSYFKSMHTILILFDITNKISFLNIDKIWLPMIEQNAETSIERILIGTKCDLENEREISIDTAKEYALNIGCNGYYEVSSKDNINVKSCIQQIIQLLDELKYAYIHKEYPFLDGLSRTEICEFADERYNSCQK